MAKIKYAQTVAGKKWYEALEERFGADGRFSRGKSYFSKGLVKKFTFQDEEVHARIKGNYGSYEIRFGFFIDTLKQEKIIHHFTNNPLLQASVLNGDLNEAFFEWAKREEIELCISFEYLKMSYRQREVLNYDAHCDCYDFYDAKYPCKHLLALWFALSQEIDHNPLVLLKLHGIELSDVLDAQDLNHEVPYPLEIVYEQEPAKKRVQPSIWPIKMLHFEDNLPFFFSLMPSNPPFAPLDYKEVLKEFYKAHAQRLPQLIAPIYTEESFKIERILKDATIEIIADKTLRENKVLIKHPLFKQEQTLYALFSPYIMDCTRQGCSLSILDFMRLFLSFKSEEGGAHYRYFYQLCRVGYLLLHANSFIPSVIKEKTKSRFFIAWIPFKSATLAEQFEVMKPHMINCVRHLQRGPFMDEISGAMMFLSALLSDYVFEMDFMHKRMNTTPPDISKAFFQGSAYMQKGAGRHNIDKAVANTFALFMLQKSSYTLEAMLLLGDDKHYRLCLFALHEGAKEPFCEALKHDTHKELLKLVAPIVLFLPEIEMLFHAESTELEKESFEAFILLNASILNALGVRITLPKELHHLLRPRLSLMAKTKKTPNTFLSLEKVLEYDWTIAIGEHTLSLEEFRALVSEQGALVEYKNTFMVVDPHELSALFAKALKKPKLSSMDLLRERFANGIVFDKSLESFFENLLCPHSITLPTLNATLRAYQQRGIQWGISNLLNHFGIILADDMGLGKTIQTIAMMVYLYENGYAKERTLVVVPTSLLNNWQNELAKFSPGLSVALYYGQGRVLPEAKVIITTYDTLKRDGVLSEHAYDILVIDEAQKIKNPHTKAAQSVKALHATYKIALSGTPVENSLSELWSIFDFTLKGYLGELSSFINRYAKPIEIEKDVAVAKTLQAITAPFMLRRLKTDKQIIDDLPEKVVIDEYATMTPKQAALYQSIVDDALNLIKNSEPQSRSGLIFKLITELKQTCNHPRNLDKISDASSDLSGKSALLLELLEPIIERGEKVLIFTQYVQMAEILRSMIEKELLIEPLVLEGSMSKKAREEVVATFESSHEHPIFILSLKAGGIGLNLTRASNVIHYDLWFNPAVENQATDRAFRIGQKRNVFVYRLITKNSFEEKIDNMIKSKMALGDMSVSVGEKHIAHMSEEEIAALMRMG